MSEGTVIAIVMIAMFIFALWAVSSSTKPKSPEQMQKELEKKEREREAAQTQKDITILEREIENLRKEIYELRTAPSGRGKRFKLK